MKKLKIGIIGTGGISQFHIEAYRKNPFVDLAAFCDINPDQLGKKADQYGIANAYVNLDDMLEQTELDAVSVCTWNSAHAPCVIKALKAGKHVLCEKPMATSAQEALAMQQAAEENNKLLMVGFIRRFGNDCAVLKDFIDANYFGDLYYAKATYLRRHGNPGGWFGDKSRSGGGPLIDLGVHVIDLVRYLMGNPSPVSVYGATFTKLRSRPGIKGTIGYTSVSKSQQDICDVEDLATAMIRFDNGAVLSVETSFSLNLEKDCGSIELFGTKAGAKLDPELKMFAEANQYLTNVSLDSPTALSFSGLFESEINHFVACISGKAACLSPAADGVVIMKILDAVYASARSGHEVVLE
jgi:predicted dehydrogenase